MADESTDNSQQTTGPFASSTVGSDLGAYLGSNYVPQQNGSWSSTNGEWNSYATAGAGAFPSSGSYYGYTTGQSDDPSNPNYDPVDAEYKVPDWAKRYGKNKAVSTVGQYVPGSSMFAGPAVAAMSAPEGKSVEAGGNALSGGVFNGMLMAANPWLGLGNYLYGTATGQDVGSNAISWFNPTGATVDPANRPALNTNSNNKQYTGAKGTKLYDDPGKGKFFGENDIMAIGAGAGNDWLSGIGDTISGWWGGGNEQQTPQMSYDPNYKPVGVSALEQAGVFNPNQSYAPQQSNPYLSATATAPQQENKEPSWWSNVGNKTMGYLNNNAGDAIMGLYGLYSAEKQRKQMADMQNNLQNQFAPDSPYARQMMARMQAKDAAAGRRGNYAGREVQLAANLAQNNASLAPSLMELQNQQNKMRMDQFGTIMGAAKNAGMFESLFGPKKQEPTFNMPSFY